MGSEWHKCNKHHIVVEDYHCPKCEDENELAQKIKDYEEALEMYAFDPYVFDEEDGDTEQLEMDKLWRHTSGKKAREVLNKYKETK